MLYRQKNEKALSASLFKDPPAEYRGTPFWAWNCELDKAELLRQIDILREMGFGGFHMHCRTGMATPYLSPEFFELIRACVDHAKENKMLAWLYDEDRWPSGAAGGIVTKEEKYRQRYLVLSPDRYRGQRKEGVIDSSAKATSTGVGTLLARYDVELHEDGTLASYRRLPEGEEAEHDAWYLYMEIASPSPWYNNQTYINTLDPAAMQRFIEVTYEGYRKYVEDEFGATIPAIFTDEPQFTMKQTLPFAASRATVGLPFSDDMEQAYTETYGESLFDRLPELIWELPNGAVSETRYRYHDFVSERFASSFADQCGAWCDAHGIALTGHMMEEATLESQCHAIGDAMRSYRSFGLPGIDMLCAYFEYNTAKQAQSAVHQYGREGMISELYGVTGWDFDFRGHKLHGDWQAALGVTIRVPHLSWVSMKGDAKRDYPASINYQSPWYEKYSYVEDHFARVATALTRGTPHVRVGVVHPIESYWLHWGPTEQTASVREHLDENFKNLTEWLLFGGIDFDFISESLLPGQCDKGENPFRVGKMAYDVVIVPACETLRASTLERLEAFRAAGGELIFLGDAPRYVDARPSDRGEMLYLASRHIAFSRSTILSTLSPYREIDLREPNGQYTNDLLHQLRDDGEGKWLFIAKGKEPYNKDIANHRTVRIRVRGHYRPTEYDTLTGELRPLACRFVGEFTELERDLYDYDSLLLRLDNAKTVSALTPAATPKGGCELRLPATVTYTHGEPNVLLLDAPEYMLDDGEWKGPLEILRIDTDLRRTLGWLGGKGWGTRSHTAQPWTIQKVEPKNKVTLRYRFFSDLALAGASLAIEDAALAEITLNGELVANTITGYYTDRSIETIPLPLLRTGENTLVITLPFGERSRLERIYILGDFGVKLNGKEGTITRKEERLGFEDITRHGFPFYGGTINYRIPFRSNGRALSLCVPHYRAAVLSVTLDGAPLGELAYPPYTMPLGTPEAGEHMLEITAYISRQNAFGHIHNADEKYKWLGPIAWRTEGDHWTDEFRLTTEGIISSPILTEEIE